MQMERRLRTLELGTQTSSMAFACLFAPSVAFETDALRERANEMEMSRFHLQGIVNPTFPSTF